MHRMRDAFRSYSGYDSIFSGRIHLNTAFYCKYNIHGLINKILPYIYYSSQHTQLNLIVSNDDSKNKVLLEYIRLLNVSNINIYKTCDIKHVDNLIKLPVDNVKMLTVSDNTLYTREWLTVLRNLVGIPGNIKKIVILRRDSHRSLQADILAFLLKQGFCPVILEELEIQEEINLFAGAEIVIGNHGSGLSNIVYCSPGTRVIEITRGDYQYVYPDFIDHTNRLLNLIPKIKYLQIKCDSDIDNTLPFTPLTSVERFIDEYNNFMS